MIKIMLASDNNQNLWDRYVLEHKDATPYHLYSWKKVVEAAYGHKGYYFIAFTDNGNNNNQKVVGVLPLIHFNIPFGRSALISLPFCDIGGPLSDEKDIEQHLFAEVLALGKEIGVNEIELRTSKPDCGLKTDDLKVGTQSHKVRMFLGLPDSSAILLSSFKSKYRNMILKGEKKGIHFEWSGVNKINEFYQVFSTNMRNLGSPVHSKLWLQAILNFYGDKARMGLVYKGHQTIGCGIILLGNNTVTAPWASILKEFTNLKPNLMLYWNFLAFAADNGYALFDFGRSSPGEGTYIFKSRWGAKPDALYWHHINSKRAATSTIDNTISEMAGIKRKLLANLWGKLPLCVANTLGPLFRKYISL